MGSAYEKLKSSGRVARKATTVRLEPSVQEGFTTLAKLLKRPRNKLINEALRGFIAKRSNELEADLKENLRRLKAYRTKDADFESVIDKFVEAEITLAGEDPVEGQRKPPAVGPAQTIVREILGG